MELWGLYMDLDKRKRVARVAYEPYTKEATHSLFVYLLVSGLFVLGTVGLFSFGQSVNALYLGASLWAVYTVMEGIMNFRVFFCILSERRRSTWLEQELTIIQIKQAFSVSGQWLEGSCIPRLYPKAQRMDAYVLICKNAQEKQVVLRTAISGQKWQILQDRLCDRPLKCTVRYGAYSRIVMWYLSDDPTTDKLNHLR